MFNWLKKLFGKEEQTRQTQVVDAGRIDIQAGGNISISTPGSIHLTAKTFEAPVPSESDRILAAIKARKPVQSTQTARRNPAPHASVPLSPSRRRDDYIDNGPSLIDYAVLHAVTSPSYDSSPSYSSSSSSDSCSSYSSSDSSSSSSSDSGSCGGGGD